MADYDSGESPVPKLLVRAGLKVSDAGMGVHFDSQSNLTGAVGALDFDGTAVKRFVVTGDLSGSFAFPPVNGPDLVLENQSVILTVIFYQDSVGGRLIDLQTLFAGADHQIGLPLIDESPGGATIVEIYARRMLSGIQYTVYFDLTFSAYQIVSGVLKPGRFPVASRLSSGFVTLSPDPVSGVAPGTHTHAQMFSEKISLTRYGGGVLLAGDHTLHDAPALGSIIRLTGLRLYGESSPTATVTARIAGNIVTGTSTAVTSTTPSSDATATAANLFTARQLLQINLSAITGSPRMLTGWLHYALGNLSEAYIPDPPPPVDPPPDPPPPTTDDNYNKMRLTAGTAGQIYTLNSVADPKINGSFTFSAPDPYARGDDGGTIIKASNGWWVRQFAHTQAAPIQLDWFQLANEANITALVERLRDTHGAATKNLHIRVPTVSRTLRIGYVTFLSWNTFSLLESDVPVTIKLLTAQIINLKTLPWVQRIQGGVAVPVWEAEIDRRITQVWSSPPVSHGVPATEVFHWGIETRDKTNSSNSVNVVKDFSAGFAAAPLARFMRQWSGIEGGKTKIVIYSTQNPSLEYGTLEGTKDDIVNMFLFNKVHTLMFGGDKLTLTIVGGYRMDRIGRGGHSTIKGYSGPDDALSEVALLTIHATPNAGNAIFKCNFRDAFGRTIMSWGGTGTLTVGGSDRFQEFRMTGLVYNGGLFLSYGIKLLRLLDFDHQDPYLGVTIWNGKTGLESGTDGPYRYADRFCSFEAGFVGDVDIDNSYAPFTVTQGVAGLSTPQSSLTWAGTSPVYYATKSGGLDAVIALWIDGAPTGKLPKTSLAAMSAKDDWFYDAATKRLYYYNATTNPAAFSRVAAVHDFRHVRRKNVGWTYNGEYVNFNSTGGKFDHVPSRGQDTRWVMYEYLPGTWGPDGAPWAIGGRRILIHEASNEEFTTNDILHTRTWSNIGSNRWTLSLTGITTNGAYLVLLVNGEAWDAIRGLRKSTQAEVVAPKNWHCTSTLLTIYSTSNPSTAFRQIIGSTWFYHNADINFVIKGFRVKHGGTRENRFAPLLETDKSGDFSQRIVWSGHDDGSFCQEENEAVLVLHEYNGCYNWKGGVIEFITYNNMQATSPTGGLFSRPATGNRGKEIQLGGNITVSEGSYDNIFDNVNFTIRNSMPRTILHVKGSGTDFTMTNVIAPVGSRVLIDDVGTSNVWVNGSKIMTSASYPFGAPVQIDFPLQQYATGKSSLKFSPTPATANYLMHAPLNGNITDIASGISLSSGVTAWVDHVAPLTGHVKFLNGRIWKSGVFDMSLRNSGITADCLFKMDEVQSLIWCTIINIQNKDDEIIYFRYNTSLKQLSASVKLGPHEQVRELTSLFYPITDGKFHRATVTFAAAGDRILRAYIDGVLVLKTNALAGTTLWGQGTGAVRNAVGWFCNYAGGNQPNGGVDECTLLNGIFTPNLGAPVPQELSQLEAIVSTMAPGEWRSIPNSTITSTFLTRPQHDAIVASYPGSRAFWGNQGPNGAIKAYNSAAFDAVKNQWYFTGGGHKDYGGNEVYRWDFNTMSWSRLNDPSPIKLENNYPIFGPLSRHTYDSLVWNTTNNTLWMFGQYGYNASTSNVEQVEDLIWEFNPVTNQWRSIVGSVWSGSFTAATLNPSTGRIWGFRGVSSGNKGMEYDLNGTAYHHNIATFQFRVNDQLDTARGKMYLFSVGDTPRAAIMEIVVTDAVPYSETKLQLTWPQDLLSHGVWQRGIAHHVPTDQFVFWGGTNAVWTWNVTEKVFRKMAVVGTAAPHDPIQCWDQFIYIPDVNIFACFTDPKGSMWLYKLGVWDGLDVNAPRAQIGSTLYLSVSAAFAAATDGVTITILPGKWKDGGNLIANNVTIEAGGAHLFDYAVDNKATIVVKGSNTIINGLECTGAGSSDGNGACIRQEGVNLTVSSVYFHDSQQGVLSNDNTGFLKVQSSTFERLGYGGLAHGVYIGSTDLLEITNCRFLSGKEQGHEIKSRSKRTLVANCVVANLGGYDSRLIDLPNGGENEIRDCVLEMSNSTSNNDLIGYGQEIGIRGTDWVVDSLHIHDNVIIIDYTPNNSRLVNVKLLSPPLDPPIILNNTIIGGPAINVPAGNTWFANRAEAGIAPYPFLPDPPAESEPPE